MAGLLLLTCALLASWRPALSSGSVRKQSAGSDVQLNCMDQCRSEAGWAWLPHYPSCVAMNSSDAVIHGSPSNAISIIHQHFGDRLVRQENGCMLLLKKAQVNDSGIFNCTTNNQSQHVILDISYNCSSPGQGKGKLGQQMKLSCCPEGKSKQKTNKHDKDSRVTWMHNGLPPNPALINKQLRSSIIINNLTQAHQGLWSCLYEDGQVAIEFCLEVQEEDHAAAPTTSPQTGESQSEVPLSAVSEEEKRHSREDGEQPIPPAAVWGIAGALAAVLIILLMVGVYCCIRGRSQGTTDSEKKNSQTETDEPAGRSASAGEPNYAVIQIQSGTGGLQAEQPRRDEEDTGEVQYCLLDFKKEEGRAVPPSDPATILYSEVARKS